MRLLSFGWRPWAIAVLLTLAPVARAGAAAGDDDGGPRTFDCIPPDANAISLRAGDRVLTAGLDHWTLLEAPSGRVIASGNFTVEGLHYRSKFYFGLSDTLFVLPGPRNEMELRDPRDGRLMHTRARVSRWQSAGVTFDGRTAWFSEERNFIFWSPDRPELYVHPTARPVSTMNEYMVRNHWRIVLGPPTEKSYYVRSIDLRDASERTRQIPLEGDRAFWFDDGSHVYATMGQWTNIVSLAGVDEPGTGPLAHDTHTRVALRVEGGVGAYYWGGWHGERRVDIFRLGKPLGPNSKPTPVASIPVEDWGMPPRDNDLAHRQIVSERGSIAVFGLNKSYFWIAALQGEQPELAQVHVPEPIRPSTFASDNRGRWSAIGDSGRIYARAGEALDTYRVIGCSAR